MGGSGVQARADADLGARAPKPAHTLACCGGCWGMIDDFPKAKLPPKPVFQVLTEIASPTTDQKQKITQCVCARYHKKTVQFRVLS